MELPAFKWIYAYIIAAFFDLSDIIFFYVFGIPVVGDAMDVIALVLLAPVLGKYSFINLAEFIPMEDPIPTYMISTVLAHREALGSPFKLRGD